MTDTQGALGMEIADGVVADANHSDTSPPESTSDYINREFADPTEDAIRSDHAAEEDPTEDPFKDEDPAAGPDAYGDPSPGDDPADIPADDSPALDAAKEFVAKSQGSAQSELSQADLEWMALCEEHGLKEQFVPDEPDKVKWLGFVLQTLEAEIVGIQAQALVQAEYFGRLINTRERKIETLVKKFSEVLEHFAKIELAGTNKRSWECESIKLSFRKSPGTIKVTDPDAAVAWCEEFAPQAVKVAKSVLVGQLKDLKGDLPGSFEVTWPGDLFSINTKIKGGQTDE